MTLHEEFAAAALQGLLAGRNPAAAPYTTEEIARLSIECADQMISQLAIKFTSVAVRRPPRRRHTPPNKFIGDTSCQY